jgi:GntR family transcriptional regulator
MEKHTLESKPMSIAAPKSPVPLYLQLADAFRQRINKGVWHKGEPVPTLEALAAEFNVARVTARQAVQLLTHEGLLSPQRGKGTFVSAKTPSSKAVNLRTSLVDLAKMYETTKPEILNIEESTRLPPTPSTRGALGDNYVYMRRVHFLDEEPYSVISIYLLQSIFAKAPVEFRTKTVIPTLLRLGDVDMHEAHQTMTIGAADTETARLLRVPMGSPIAQVERFFKDRNGTLFYYADVAYRGDWVRWEIDLKQ